MTEPEKIFDPRKFTAFQKFTDPKTGIGIILAYAGQGLHKTGSLFVDIPKDKVAIFPSLPLSKEGGNFRIMVFETGGTSKVIGMMDAMVFETFKSAGYEISRPVKMEIVKYMQHQRSIELN